MGMEIGYLEKQDGFPIFYILLFFTNGLIPCNGFHITIHVNNSHGNP